jgi:hypothetical protein
MVIPSVSKIKKLKKEEEIHQETGNDNSNESLSVYLGGTLSLDHGGEDGD